MRRRSHLEEGLQLPPIGGVACEYGRVPDDAAAPVNGDSIPSPTTATCWPLIIG
jgi:hypothetical protein